MTIYRYQPRASQSTVPGPVGRLALSRLRILRPETFGPLMPQKEIDGYRHQRRNKMLGLGLVGTIIVIVLIVWLVRAVL
jgi:hypothetical protein